jgi:hypothetical protein
MSNKAYISLSKGQRICIERDSPFIPRMIESNRTPTLTQSIEATCLDIENVSDKISKFVFSTEGLGESIRSGVKELGQKIIQIVRKLINKITEFFESVFTFFKNKYHKYILYNLPTLKENIQFNLALMVKHAKQERDTGLLNLEEYGSTIYAIILGSLKFGAWFSRISSKIATPFKKIQDLLNRTPHSPEEAQQMAQEVEPALSIIIQTSEEGEKEIDKIQPPQDAKGKFKVLIDSITASPVLEKSKDFAEGVMNKAKEGLKKAEAKIQAAMRSNNTEEINLWSKITNFFQSIVRFITNAPLLKGMIHRDREILKYGKRQQLEDGFSYQIEDKTNPEFQPA